MTARRWDVGLDDLCDQRSVVRTSYTLGVAALDAAGNVSATATTGLTTAACPDTSAPSTPTGLAASAVGQTSATLSWTASSDNVGVAGYRVFRNGSQVGTSSGTTYTATGLLCATSYAFGVAALDAAGNVSGTATKSVSTPACIDTTPPSTPTGLIRAARADLCARCPGTASTDDFGVTGYRALPGRHAGGSLVSVGYIFGGLTCATNYTLRCRGGRWCGQRSTTATIGVTTAACPTRRRLPRRPGSRRATSARRCDAGLDASTDNVGVTGYRLYQNGTQVGTATSTTYSSPG